MLAFSPCPAAVLVLGGLAILLFVFVAFVLTQNAGPSAYDQIGAGGLSREGEFTRAQRPPAPGSAAEQAEREQEVRQMLSARSERLVRAGHPALDVESELSRLLASEAGRRASRAGDAGLVAEVRQLVLARNERRARQGLAPLDVDDEVRRTLEELES